MRTGSGGVEGETTAKVSLRKYRPKQDFLRIRDFLSYTYRTFGEPLNWRIERWNYVRYFVAPVLGTYRQKEPTRENCLKTIRFWEDSIGVWESEDDEIVGVVNIEYPDPEHPGYGEAFFQRHPRYPFIIDEMLEYAEANFVNWKTNTLHIYIYDHDESFQVLVQERGYEKDVEDFGYDSEFVINSLPEMNLPDGYLLQSMAQENDIELKREGFGRAFNHTDPSEWPSVFSYEELQRAPDYRKDLDLYIIGPGGKYVSCCIVWYDEQNKLGVLEPVGTHPDFRRIGLGREVVLEGIRRVSDLGAETVCVGSDQLFYKAIGFQRKYISYRWTRRF